MLDFLFSAVGAPIAGILALAIIFLGALVLSAPALLWRGCINVGRGIVTLLLPGRRAKWLQRRKADRAQKQRTRESIALLTKEIAEFGREEARRRSMQRSRAELAEKRQARRAAQEDGP